MIFPATKQAIIMITTIEYPDNKFFAEEIEKISLIC